MASFTPTTDIVSPHDGSFGHDGIRFSERSPQRQMATFAISPRWKFLTEKALRPGEWSTVVGQPCHPGEGLLYYQRSGGELSQARNHWLHCTCLFPQTSAELLAFSRSFLNVCWRKGMNQCGDEWMNESWTWNVSFSAQKFWFYEALSQTFLTDHRNSQEFCCLTTSWPFCVSQPYRHWHTEENG